MKPLWAELLELTEQQEQLIVKQNEIIKKLVNENAEKESIITEVFNENSA